MESTYKQIKADSDCFEHVTEEFMFQEQKYRQLQLILITINIDTYNETSRDHFPCDFCAFRNSRYILFVHPLECARFAHARALGSIDSPRARLSAINLGVCAYAVVAKRQFGVGFVLSCSFSFEGTLINGRSNQVDGSVPVNFILSYRGISLDKGSKELPR